MVRPQKIENSTQELVNDYLSSFRSQNTTSNGADAASETGIDEYLLERAATELRAAQERLDTLKRELGKD